VAEDWRIVITVDDVDADWNGLALPRRPVSVVRRCHGQIQRRQRLRVQYSRHLATQLKVKGCLCLFIRIPSHSYGAAPAIWDHTVLPASRHR